MSQYLIDIPTTGSPTIAAYTPPASTTATANPPATTSPGQIALPAGQSQIWRDNFTSLDTTKWIPQIADQNGIWSNDGKLSLPLSADTAGTAASFDAEYFDPSQLSFGSNGLVITAVRDTSQPGYIYRSGVVSTHGKYTLPAKCSVEFLAKQPDSTTGAWASGFCLEGGPEVDIQESGFTSGTTNVNDVVATHVLTSSSQGVLYNDGADLSQGFHLYRFDFHGDGTGMSYIDGKATRGTPFTGIGTTGKYTMIFQLAICLSDASSWHSVTSAATPETLTYEIAELLVSA